MFFSWFSLFRLSDLQKSEINGGVFYEKKRFFATLLSFALHSGAVLRPWERVNVHGDNFLTGFT